MCRQKVLLMLLNFAAATAWLGCEKKPSQGSTQPSSHIYMDIHNHVEGLTAEAVAGAHQKDLAVQGKYGVNYLKYWYDEGTGKVFCLVEAPSEEAAAAVHKEAHGLVADEIIKVNEGH